MLVKAAEGSRSQWEIEEDFRTLQRAREIMQDEKRLKDVQKLVKEQKEALEDMSDDDFYKNIGLGD